MSQVNRRMHSESYGYVCLRQQMRRSIMWIISIHLKMQPFFCSFTSSYVHYLEPCLSGTTGKRHHDMSFSDGKYMILLAAELSLVEGMCPVI